MNKLDSFYTVKKNKFCMGYLGFPVREAIAKAMEDEVKKSEKDGFGYKRVWVNNASEELIDGERADISIVTDATIDMEKDCVLPHGMDTRIFDKSRIITLGHDYALPPVGRCQWLIAERYHRNSWSQTTIAQAERIKAKIKYAPRPDFIPPTVEWIPDTIWGLVRGDESGSYLPGKSIGFLVQQMRAPTQKEVDMRPELANIKNVISKYTLLEIAVCTIPMNPSALQVARAKGLNMPTSLQYADEYYQRCMQEYLCEDEDVDCFTWAEEIPMPKHVVNWDAVARALKTK